MMLLENTCLDWGAYGHDVYYGYGIVKIDRLLSGKTLFNSEVYDSGDVMLNLFLQYANPQFISYNSVVAARYSTEGRLLGTEALTGGGSYNLTLAVQERIKLFFLGAAYQPLSGYALYPE
jgi:hypothetical protein